MTRDEIINWYRRAQKDFWHQEQLAVNALTLTAASGISGRIMPFIFTGEEFQGARIGEKGYARLEETIGLIESRSVIWYGQCVEYFKPPKRRPCRAKIGDARGFSLFDICASCGGSKWLMGEIDGKARMVCYTCLPPSQWAASGIGWTGINVIRVFLEDKGGAYGFI